MSAQFIHSSEYIRNFFQYGSLKCVCKWWKECLRILHCTCIFSCHALHSTTYMVLLLYHLCTFEINLQLLNQRKEYLFNLDILSWINLRLLINSKSMKLIRCEYFLFLLQRTSLCTIKYTPVFSGSCARTCVSYIMQYFQSGLQWRFRRMMRNFHSVEWSKSFLIDKSILDNIWKTIIIQAEYPIMGR